MIQLDRSMLELIKNKLQIGSEAPSYALRVKRIEDIDQDPYEFKGVPNGVTSIEITSTSDSGATSADVKIADAYGLLSPDVLEYRTGELCITPSNMTIKPGETAQFYAYVKTGYNNILVGGAGALHPEMCTWRLEPYDDGIDHGDWASLQIENGLVKNTTLHNVHFASCKVSASYKDKKVYGSVLVVDKTYIIDVPNPVFMVRDNEDEDGDMIFIKLNAKPAIFKTSAEVKSAGYGIVGSTSNVYDGIVLKSVDALYAPTYGFKPPGTNYSVYGKKWTEIPLQLHPGINTLTITATWNGKYFNGSGWTMGNVTGNAQLCYPDANRTPKYTEDGAGGTQKMDPIYFDPIRINMSSGAVSNDSIAGPQAGLYDLEHNSGNPRQTVTWLIEYVPKENLEQQNGIPEQDLLIDVPESYYPWYKDEQLTDYNRSHYRDLFIPENYIQLCLGYGDIVVPVITGAIDTVQIDSKESVLSLSCRDNMRYLIDQNINALKYGTALKYPKADIEVKGSINPDSTINNSKRVKLASGISSVAVRSGPSNSSSIIGNMKGSDTCVYLGTTNGWHNIIFGNSTGYVYGGYVTVYITSKTLVGTVPIGTYQQRVKIRSNTKSLTVYAMASTTSTHIGTALPGDTYAYVRTVASGTMYNIDYNSMSGYVETKYCELTTVNSDGVANLAVFEIVGAPQEFYLKSDPSDGASNVVRVYNGDILNIKKIVGDWRQVTYPVPGPGGKTYTGYIYKDYTKVIYIPKPIDPNAKKKAVQWKATDIVMDLAVDATTLRCFVPNPLLDRNVCNVLIEDYYVLEEGEMAQYTVPSKSFSMEESYFDACMEVVNLLGEFRFKCTRYGDIWLRKIVKHTQLDIPDWIIQDYVDLTSMTYIRDSVDQRNRVIVKSTDGWNMYEFKLATIKITKGVNRTTCINADFADTEAKRRDVAVNFFEQILAKYKHQEIAIKGNPLVELGQTVFLQDKISGANDLYEIVGWKHSLSNTGMVTQLDLNYISTIDKTDLIMLTDQFPSERDTFNYDLYTTPFEKKDITIKYDTNITRLVIKISKSGITLAQISVVQTVEGHTENVSSSKQYVIIKGNGVNLRVKPTGSVKRVANYGEIYEYIAVTGDNGSINAVSTSKLPDPTSGDWPKANRWDSYFIEAGTKYGMDPCLIKAVCMQESSGRNSDELGKDSDGAVGPMRVLDGSIAKGAYSDLKAKGLTTYSRSDLLNTRINILVGAQILKYVYDTYHCTDVRVMLGYYNGGGASNTVYPNAVNRWYKTLTGKDLGGPLSGSFVVSKSTTGTGNWYACKDHDGSTIYVWKAFCSIQKGGTSVTTSSTVDTTQSTKASQFIAVARQQLGKWYKWGAEGPNFFDCSGLVQYCLGRIGISFPRVTYTQYPACNHISESSLLPGDLCFAVNAGSSPNGMGNHHVAIYIGNGQIIEAWQTGYPVRITSLRSSFNYFGRIPALTSTSTYVNTVTLPTGTSTSTAYVPDQFSVTTTYNINNATAAEKALASKLGGHVLCATDGLVLYSTTVESVGTNVKYNQVRMKWASTLKNPITVNLTFDVALY